MPFFVELAQDEFGNRAYTNSYPCVIEADVNDKNLIIKAPQQIKNNWPTIKNFGDWIECDGPARPLSKQERDAIIIIAIGAKLDAARSQSQK